MQIARSLSSERRMWCRASTTSMGERPANGLPLVAVGGRGEVYLTGLGILMAGGGSLRESMTAFLERGTRFLRVDRAFRGDVFGYGEARLLSERRVA